ncbi:sodium:solute symporter family transporter [Roseimaritima sediminicola]|uniref:sodium:solute symporter family transporter n=1 Tax=Roseimaritima sediminicola TaxID=2662066 RepID=UPI0012983212|nr:transporter [Roseimaritima sediminicola]
MPLNISAIDTAIILVYVAATVVFGLYLGRTAKDLSSFLVGGRNLPWYAVLGSIVATETSAVTFLSIPGITYATGGDFSFLQLAAGFVLGRWLVVWWFLPRFFEGQIFTAYDILHQRFGGLTQRTASLIFMITRTVSDGLRLYLTAIVLEKVTGLGIAPCIASIGAVTILYASFGGIRSVVWNDCIQLLVYLAGAVAAVWTISAALPDGLTSIVGMGAAEGKFQGVSLDFGLTSANLWVGLLGGCFISLATHGTDQMMVQRYLCSATRRGARWAVALSGPAVFAQFALFLFLGVALMAFDRAGGSGAQWDKDEALAAYVVQYMPVGLCGITLAAVFSVAMSTLSSSLSSSASAVVNDFVKPVWERRAPSEDDSAEAAARMDRRLTRASRWWTAIFGVLQVGVGIVVASTPALSAPSVIFQVIAVAGLASGLILGVFLLDRSARRWDQRSILFGMATGFIVTTVVIMAPEGSPLKIHSWWSAVVASLTTVAVSYAVDTLLSLRSKSSS